MKEKVLITLQGKYILCKLTICKYMLKSLLVMLMASSGIFIVNFEYISHLALVLLLLTLSM